MYSVHIRYANSAFNVKPALSHMRYQNDACMIVPQIFGFPNQTFHCNHHHTRSSITLRYTSRQQLALPCMHIRSRLSRLLPQRISRVRSSYPSPIKRDQLRIDSIAPIDKQQLPNASFQNSKPQALANVSVFYAADAQKIPYAIFVIQMFPRKALSPARI